MGRPHLGQAGPMRDSGKHVVPPHSPRSSGVAHIRAAVVPVLWITVMIDARWTR